MGRVRRQGGVGELATGGYFQTKVSHRGDEQLEVFGLERVLVVGIQMFKLLQQGGVVHLQGFTHETQVSKMTQTASALVPQMYVWVTPCWLVPATAIKSRFRHNGSFVHSTSDVCVSEAAAATFRQQRQV